MDKRELFAMKLSFEEFNLFFLPGGSERLDCFEPTEAARFLKKVEVHSVLYGHRKYVFKREFLCLERFHGRFLHFDLSVKKMCIWNWFFAMCSADWTCVNGCRIQLVLYANCFLGLTYGFLKKNFQEIKLFICHCSKHDRETTDRKIFRKTSDGLFPIPELRLKVLFLYMFHWIAIHFIIHYLPFNISAVCYSFSINRSLSTVEAAYKWSLFSVVCLRLYVLVETVSLPEI